MLLRNKQKNIEAWKCNPDVIIHDSASSDVLADLLQIDIETFASDYGEDFIRRRDARYVKRRWRHRVFITMWHIWIGK